MEKNNLSMREAQEDGDFADVSQSSADAQVSGQSPKHDGKFSSVGEFVSRAKQRLAAFKSPRFSAAYIAKIAILTAISFLLYAFGKFNLPMIFPQFLEIQISELPALLAGFAMGPIGGCIVVVLKCLLKMPLTSTAYVGELTDIILGVAFVLPASVIYHLRRGDSRKSGIIHALVGLAVGSLFLTAMSLVVNRYISAPFYIEMYFGGNIDGLVDMLRPLYPAITQETFYSFYLFAGVLPFNLLRCIIVSLLTFLLYKRLSKILHWEGTSLRKKKSTETLPLIGSHISKSVEDTHKLARELADQLDGGETILLNGELGAGKTTFTKGLAKALGISEEITSPTFTLLNVYSAGRLTLNHIDMYRAESEDELYELGLGDVFDDGAVTVIEWNKFRDLKGRIYTIDISSKGGDERTINISYEEK